MPAITIRTGTPDDHPAFVRLFAELGVPDPVPTLPTFVDRFAATTMFACAGDTVVGFLRWRPYGDLAHVINVVTDPAWRGQRIGQHMLEAARLEARTAGCSRWYLNVKQDNAAGLRLYERCGFVTACEAWSLSMTWAAAHALPGPRVETRLATVEDDGPLGAALGVRPQRIEALRTRPGLVPLVAMRDDIVGFAAFMPSLPGAAPFASREPRVAGPLLVACHAYARSEQVVRLSVERDQALRDELVTGGATIDFAMFQMDAAL